MGSWCWCCSCAREGCEAESKLPHGVPRVRVRLLRRSCTPCMACACGTCQLQLVWVLLLLRLLFLHSLLLLVALEMGLSSLQAGLQTHALNEGSATLIQQNKMPEVAVATHPISNVWLNARWRTPSGVRGGWSCWRV